MWRIITIFFIIACNDRSNKCPEYKTKGYCETRQRAMVYHCQNTCNLCGTTLQRVNLQNLRKKSNEKAHYPPIVRATRPPAECKDNHKNCDKLVGFGWCQKQRSRMERLCPKSCHFCGESKQDQHTEAWKGPTKPSLLNNKGILFFYKSQRFRLHLKKTIKY